MVCKYNGPHWHTELCIGNVKCQAWEDWILYLLFTRVLVASVLWQLTEEWNPQKRRPESESSLNLEKEAEPKILQEPWGSHSWEETQEGTCSRGSEPGRGEKSLIRWGLNWGNGGKYPEGVRGCLGSHKMFGAGFAGGWAGQAKGQHWSRHQTFPSSLMQGRVTLYSPSEMS